MNIQRLEHKDLPLLSEVQPHDWPDIKPYFEFYTSSPFCFPIKVILDKKIIGIGTVILHQKTAWLAHIIVSQLYRNRGVGQFITRSLIELSREKNCTSIYLIATDLGAPVYEKLGFETETNYLFFKDLKPILGFIPSENIAPIQPTHLNQIASLDQIASGENRFIHLEKHLSHGYVYLKGAQVEGFYLPTFGEGLILANHPKAGIELMKTRINRNERASFPIENLIATNYLEENGYTAFKSAKRMWLGKKIDWVPEKLFNRIGGNVG